MGTNSQKSGYPVWATTDYIQSFCSYGNCMGKFVSAKVPLYNENNVGFSQTFANLLLPTLPKGHGIVLLNTRWCLTLNIFDNLTTEYLPCSCARRVNFM